MEPIVLARQLTKSLQIYHIMPLLSRMVHEYLVADKCNLTHFHSSKEKKVSSPQFDFAKRCLPYLKKIVCNWLR